MDFSKLTPKQFKELTAGLLKQLREDGYSYTRISRLKIDPTCVFLEGQALKAKFNTKNMELIVWSGGQRYAGADTRLVDLMQTQEICRDWQRHHKHFEEWS